MVEIIKAELIYEIKNVLRITHHEGKYFINTYDEPALLSQAEIRDLALTLQENGKK